MKHTAAIKGFFKYAIGFAVLAYVVVRNWEGKPGADGTPTPGLRELVGQVPDWGLVVAVLLLMIATVACQYVRWYLLVRALDLPFTMRNAFRLGMVGYFYNTCLPGSIGGDLIKAIFIAREQHGRRAAAVATVIADRFMGLFGLLLFAAAVGGFCWFLGDSPIEGSVWLQRIIATTGVMVAATVVGWVVLGFLPAHRYERFLKRLQGVPKVGHTLAELWWTMHAYRQRPNVVYQCVLISALSHLFMISSIHLSVRIYPLAEPATLPEHFILAPIGFIAQVFFPAPGGVGGGEAIFGYLYTLVNRPEATGVIARLSLRLFEIAIGFVGYVAFLQMRKELPLEEEPELPEEPDEFADIPA